MRIYPALAATILLAGCVAPTPPSAPTPEPRRAAPPPPAPVIGDWRDAPLTPGTWTYMPSAQGSSASFGRPGAPPDFVVRCTLPARTIILERPGPAGTELIMIDIATSAGQSAYRAQSLSSRQAAAASTPAADPFLDKIAFSRGRFAVSVTARPRLILPAWPEVTRVVEDCR